MRRAWLGVWMLALLLAGCGGQPAGEEPLRLEAEADAYTAVLEISPGIVGPNTFRATVTDQDGQAVEAGEAVLHFAMPGMDHGTNQMALTPQAAGVWTGEGPHLMMTGQWELRLEWISPQGERHAFSYALELKD